MFDNLTTRPAPEATVPQRSYSYGRISSGGRKKGSQALGDGLRRQQGKLDDADESWPERVSAQHGWSLDDTLRFTDKGRSGFHLKNLTPTAHLTRFLRLIESGRITPGSVLLLDKLDRLSRAELDLAYDLFRAILRAGVWICTRVPERLYRHDQPASFMDMIEPLWIMYLNWMESVKKQDNAVAAWQSARHYARKERTPIPTFPPFWLRRTEAGYEPIPDQVAVVQRLFALARLGQGYGAIVGILQREGVPAPGYSGRWNATLIRNVLRGRQVLGEYQPQHLVQGVRRPLVDQPAIAGFYPQVIPEVDWLAAQAAIASRRRRCGRPPKRIVNLFTGLLRAADTAERLTIFSRPHSSYTYVVDRERRTTYLRYDRLEAHVLDALAQLRPQDVLEPALRSSEREHEIARLTSRLVALDHRLQELQLAAADPAQDAGLLLPSLRLVAADRETASRQLAERKLESSTGRAEALAETQTLNEARRATVDPGERVRLDQRIKAALPTVVEGIWIRRQPVSARVRIVHVQIFVLGGPRLYLQIVPEACPCATRPSDWSALDFRTLAAPTLQTAPPARSTTTVSEHSV